MSRRWVMLAAIGLFVIVFDQWSKFMAVKHLTPALDESPGLVSAWVDFYTDVHHPCAGAARAQCRRVTVIEDVWYWSYVENPGAAFGFMRDASSSIRNPFFMVVSVAAAIFILSIFRNLRDDQWWMIVALSLVFGGAVGNLLDRIHLGYVIDFIDNYIGTYHWPTYNVADSGISVGVVMMLLEWLRDAVRGGSAKESESSEREADAKGAS